MNNLEQKIELIKSVQAAASFWDAVAINDALVAVDRRHSADRDELMQRASESSARRSAAHKLRDEVINLINAKWPCDPPVK